jgi:hypothetical protein
MKTLHSIFVIILITIILISQSCKHKVQFAQRMVRGGPEKVIIDNKTSLRKLIKKLNSPWELAETGAGYWIGYTDDMFSIASYKDKAIRPLTSFIRETDSIKGKIGGLYTLHLIGIKSTVVGRSFEHFSDTLARKAILSLLDDQSLNRYVTILLKRDPWPMDIPYLIDYLDKSDNDYTYVLSAFRKYFLDLEIENRPLFEDLPEEIYDKEVTIKTEFQYYFHPIADLIGLKCALGNQMKIDKEILDSKEWNEGLKVYSKTTGEDLIQVYKGDGTERKTRLAIRFIDSFGLDPAIDYSGWEDKRFYYSFHDNKLFIYSKKNAALVILNWWKSMPQEEKIKILRKKSLYESINKKYSS